MNSALDEARYSFAGTNIESRTASIATYAHSRHRFEVFDDALCHVLALPYFEEYGDVLEQMLSVEAADRQALDS